MANRAARFTAGAAYGIAALAATPSAAQDFDPSTLDLPALVECRADIGTYNEFAFWLAGEPTSATRLGWTEIPTDNSFLRQYSMQAPLHVFNRQTHVIAFTSTGPMAVFDNAPPAELASELGVMPAMDTPEKFLGEKVVIENTVQEGDISATMRISLNVSTVDTYPGQTLAGCSYAMDIQ